MSSLIQNHEGIIAIVSGVLWVISEVLAVFSGSEKAAGIVHGLLLFLQNLGAPKFPEVEAPKSDTNKAA